MAQREQFISCIEGLDVFIVEDGPDSYLIYAPLSGVALEATGDDVTSLKQAAKGLPSTSEANDVMRQLLKSDSPIVKSAMPETINELTILVNQRCNFTCSYCYSAKGRSSDVLSMEQLTPILDFFVSSSRGEKLSIVFSGGGDPVLSFPIIACAVEYAEQLAYRQGIVLDVGLVTNGSTLDDQMIRFIKEHGVSLVLSFDILEDVHNRQRSHYDVVASTLYRMSEAGLDFGIRTTVTPLNVLRQEEMVEELHSRFPNVRSAAFEAVLSYDLFATEQEQASLYESFVGHFFRALKLGQHYGIIIGNTLFNSLDSCKERACPGKLVIVPNGSLVACSRVSSPNEPHFLSFQYGQCNHLGVEIDDAKYRNLMLADVNSHSECRHCIAKWHCGGGCLLARRLLGSRMKLHCDFTRQMIIESVKYRML